MLKIYKNFYKFLSLNSPAMQASNLKITLTEPERQLFVLLKKYRADTKRQTVIRVAGGWVRDKVRSRQRSCSAGRAKTLTSPSTIRWARSS